jgi:hypothetical protein
MRKLIRPLAAAVCIACLTVSSFVMTTDNAMAQDQAATPVKQMALTKKQIEGVLAAQKDMDAINEKQSEHAMPYLIVTEQLETPPKSMASPATTNTTTSSTTSRSFSRASIRRLKNTSAVKPSLERRSRRSRRSRMCQLRKRRKRSPS